MSVTIDLITADFNAVPKPTLEFLQGRNMDVLSIRTTLRKIEESVDGVVFEGNPDPDGLIVKSSGNEFFNESVGEKNALTVTILPPFDVKFQSGSKAFVSSGGNLLFSGLDSPGAIVQINNAVGAISLSSKDIEHSAFDGGVTLDPVNGKTIADGGTGNTRLPLKNLAEVKGVLISRGFNRVFIVGAVNISSADNIDNLAIVGSQSPRENVIILESGSSAKSSSFKNVEVSGITSGEVDILEMTHIRNLSGISTSSNFHNVLLEGLLTFGATGAEDLHVLDCLSGSATSDNPGMDFAGVTPLNAVIRNHHGDLLIKGVTNGTVYIGLNHGIATIDPTCTGGTIHINERTNVIDKSNGTTIVGGIRVAQVASDVANSALTFKTDLPSTENNSYKDTIVQFMTGVLSGEIKKVSISDGSTKILTFSSQFSLIPTTGDIFKVINL